jgi:hypothetical protein
MNFQQFKMLILAVTAVSALLVASPALQQFIVAPPNESLTELALFGQYRNGTYPSGIAQNVTYRVYVNVTNHLGSAAYYQIQLKFRNATQSGPDSFNKTSSSLPPIGTMSLVIANQKSMELPVDLSFHAKLDSRVDGLLDMQDIVVNGAALNVNGTTIRWDMAKNGFYGNLVFELWRYNDSTNAFQYDQRFVSLWLKFYVT